MYVLAKAYNKLYIYGNPGIDNSKLTNVNVEDESKNNMNKRYNSFDFKKLPYIKLNQFGLIK